jgi:hypothetical protein
MLYLFVLCIFVWRSDCERGLGLDVEFIDYFNTQLVITLSFGAIADLHTLQITAAHSLLLDVSW